VTPPDDVKFRRTKGMTGYTVNTGSTQKFSEGWDRIFSGDSAAKRSKKDAKAPSLTTSVGKKAPAKAKTAKKAAGRSATGTKRAGRHGVRSSSRSAKR
jgi:hypothetical protein